MGTITKRDLVVQISDQTGLTQHQVFDVLQLFLDNVTSHLAQNNEVVLRNFGTFEIRVAKAKIGRNPNAPAKDVVIPARAIVKFRPTPAAPPSGNPVPIDNEYMCADIRRRYVVMR